MHNISRGLIVLALFLIGVTFAQVFGWRNVLPMLTEEDIEIIGKTGRGEMDGKSEGSVLEWVNPKSGASGTVTLRRRFSFNEHECRELLHFIKARGNEPWHFLTKICLEDGNWKMLEPPRHTRKPVKESE